MFKLDPKPTFQATVALSVPGSEDPVRVPFTFRHMTSRRFGAWVGGAQDYGTELDFLLEAVVGWGPGVGDDGGEVAFSREAFERLLDNYPAAAKEILLAYTHELTDARAKN